MEAMAKQEVAYRKSTPWLPRVKMGDGRMVKNACYDPRAKRKSGKAKGAKLSSRSVAPVQPKKKTENYVVRPEQLAPSGLEMERDGDSGYIDIGGGEEIYIENIYDESLTMKVKDSDGNLTDIITDTGNVTNAVSKRRRERLHNIDIPDVAHGGHLGDYDHRGFVVDDGETETEYQYDEDGDIIPYSNYTHYTDNPRLSSIEDEAEFVRAVFSWDKDTGVPDDLIKELNEVRFFDVDEWEAETSPDYYYEHFDGFSFSNKNELNNLLDNIGVHHYG